MLYRPFLKINDSLYDNYKILNEMVHNIYIHRIIKSLLMQNKLLLCPFAITLKSYDHLTVNKLEFT